MLTTIKPLLLISTITTLCLSIQINEKNLNDIKGTVFENYSKCRI